MNYLAHLFLSPDQPQQMAGNYMADMIKSIEEKNVLPHVKKGIELHRVIDHSTDHHPIFVEHRRMLYPHFRKYAGVVLDIYYDYLLFLNWKYVTCESFGHFEKRIYDTLLKAKDDVPPRITDIMMRMISDRWLRHYTTMDGMNRVFGRLERKVKFPIKFHDAMEVLNEQIPQWRREHLIFFKDMKKTVSQFEQRHHRKK